jgi:methylenetetrahydrofolate reductase (NADPH)
MSTAAQALPEPEHPIRAAIREALRSATIETSAKNLTEIDAYAGLLPPGTEVYVTWLPTDPYQHLVSVASRLVRAGYRPVPHIAARRLADEASARDFLARLAGEAGVDQALVMAGDVDRPVGPYESAAEFMESGMLERQGIRKVGLAGYPEGHPRIPEATLARALERKIGIARRAGLEPYLVSQFCFEADPILRWLERLREAGIDLPVKVGLAGPASVRTLLAYGARCGVGGSLRAIKSHGISLTRLVAQSGPEHIVARLATARRGEGLGPQVSLHFFSFGGFEKTARWMSQVARGEFQLTADASTFQPGA